MPRHLALPRPALLATVAGVLLCLLVALAAAPPAGAALSRAQFPVLAQGSTGLDVLALQRLLRHAGSSIAADGEFDAATRDALRAFQKAAALTADGVARGPTWRALAPRLGHGDRGDAVRAVQEMLNRKRGAALTVNGELDAATAAAVRVFQKRVGLARTGVVDADTWRHLVWLFMRPRLEGSLCGYEIVNGRSAKWGTAGAIAQLERAAALYGSRTGSRMAVGDISLELGGNISGHRSHQVGLDVDLRPARKDGRECRWGIAYTMRTYDRAGTRALIKAIRDAAPGRVRLIYFNDPVLIREGLVQRYPNHDAHLHVRFCEVDHPSRAYRCPRAADRAAQAATTSSEAEAPGVAPAAAQPGERSTWAALRSFWAV